MSDSDFAGDQTTRRSISSGQVYVNRALILSFVRGQKAITLSLGEAEYMALTATTSEAIHIKNMWEYMIRADANLVARTDSSVARAISSRQGVGRIRHLSVASLWLHNRVQCRDISVRAIGTVFNPSDVGTKVLSVQRLRLLCYIMGTIKCLPVQSSLSCSTRFSCSKQQTVIFGILQITHNMFQSIPHLKCRIAHAGT